MAATTQNDSELFADVLNLEEQYYTEGYSLGVADGSRAGRIEGRIFGLEKGFEKFAEMGRLTGRADVWTARLPGSKSNANVDGGKTGVLPLSASDRLKKHVAKLADLTDPETLSTENTEDGVADVDDALRDAKSKATLIAKIVGEEGKTADVANSTPGGSQEVQSSRGSKAKRTGEMEDFIGLPNVRSSK
ncbi:ribosome biosynthesis protein LTO1 [Acrodontium crateriforme]|uniref:Ribosome biosynthesis protein LTO1 n=1 Tax=Acrodontium crateriforme TaxID=150365 RepID=A0AAQ3LZ59_9PEZI|nr:ribosome biosynthesis protein LTO1 [Acrodontium crateriforme]